MKRQTRSRPLTDGDLEFVLQQSLKQNPRQWQDPSYVSALQKSFRPRAKQSEPEPEPAPSYELVDSQFELLIQVAEIEWFLIQAENPPKRSRTNNNLTKKKYRRTPEELEKLGLYRYPCPACGKKYIAGQNLRNHQAKEHPDIVF